MEALSKTLAIDSSWLESFVTAGCNHNQIGTMLQRIAFATEDKQLKALRFHAIDLLTADDSSFAGFRHIARPRQKSLQCMREARMTEQDLSDDQVQPLLLLAGSMLNDIREPVEKVESMTEETHGEAIGVLDHEA
jgi:hypothetical protein